MKKKNLIVLLLIAVIGIVGVTIAYFSSRATFENVFETPEYGTTYIEKFTSPDNWLPGDETEKKLQVTNSGNVDEAVRIKVEESWVSKRGTTLPLTQGNNVAALINFINDDDWTKVTFDGEDYYYYYYNYKLAPEETTSKLLDKVTFNPLINGSTTCSDTVVDGVTTRICNSNGEGYDGATYALNLTVETVQYNKYKEAWNTNVAIAEEKPQPEPTGVEYLATTATNEANTEYNADTKGKMFQFSHTVNGNTVSEARYIGDAPNNYVYFNCDEPQEGVEYNYADSCEVWRILGIFDVQRTDPSDSSKSITETRMKLVRGTFFASTMVWDTNNVNDWSNSSLKIYLNETYYVSLSETAQSQIEDSVYYLGGSSWNNTSNYGSTEEIYVWERGNDVYNGRSTSWKGKISLMYPSDMYMTYANGADTACYNNPYICSSKSGGTPTVSWIYNTNILQESAQSHWSWFLSPYASSSSIGFTVGADGRIYGNADVYYDAGVRPVVYLKSDIQIIDGDGSEQNPYKLK